MHFDLLTVCVPTLLPRSVVDCPQELAIWREQRDDAKQRKATGVARTSSGRTDGGGLSGAPGEADATGTSGTKADEKSEAKPTDEVHMAMFQCGRAVWYGYCMDEFFLFRFVAFAGLAVSIYFCIL